MTCVCSRYNAHSDWLILGHYSPIKPRGQLRVCKNQVKKPCDELLINLESSICTRVETHEMRKQKKKTEMGMI